MMKCGGAQGCEGFMQATTAAVSSWHAVMSMSYPQDVFLFHTFPTTDS